MPLSSKFYLPSRLTLKVEGLMKRKKERKKKRKKEMMRVETARRLKMKKKEATLQCYFQEGSHCNIPAPG